MKLPKTYIIIFSILLPLFMGGCSVTEMNRAANDVNYQLNDLIGANDPAKEMASIQEEVKSYDQSLIQALQQGKINFAQAAKLKSGKIQELLHNSKHWQFDNFDQEFHSYKIVLGEMIDNKKISIDQAKYLSANKQNEIATRASQQGLNWVPVW